MSVTAPQRSGGHNRTPVRSFHEAMHETEIEAIESKIEADLD